MAFLVNSLLSVSIIYELTVKHFVTAFLEVQ